MDDYETTHNRKRKHKHKHKHQHRDKKREKVSRTSYISDGSDVEIIESKSTDQNETAAASNNSSHTESLSIEETNKLRAKLGLKPLEVSGQQTDANKGKLDDGKKKDDLGEFYHRPAENWAHKAEQEKIRTKLAECREKRLLHSKLSKVKTLATSDSDDDTFAWIDKSRKIESERKEAEKREKMLEELDAQFGISEIVEQEQKKKRQKLYTEKDLRGLTVEHDINSFTEEKDIILTLKDNEVLKADEDVLINVNMIDNEKYKKNIENKTRKLRYNAYEDTEYDEYGNPKEKVLLEKYDEEIDGENRQNFKIGYDDSVKRHQEAIATVKEKLARTKLESVEMKDLKLASEYYNEEEMAKFKKPKKKNRKIRSKGKLTTADDGHNYAEIIDDVPDVKIPYDIKLEDEKDDLLEKALHKARKIKQKENILADMVKMEIDQEIKEENPDSGNIVLNSTAEFCRTLGDIPTYGKSGNRDEDGDLIDFERDYEDEKSDDDNECEIVESISGWNTVDLKNEKVNLKNDAPQEIQILDEEPDVSTGVGAALKLAMSKGYLDKEQNNRPSNSKLAHLQAQHYSIEDKSYSEESDRAGGGAGGGGGGRGRERYSGPTQEFKEKDGFKPNVKLEYIDDDGHLLNAKEAFRYLSHKFHGKGPGKNKVEKRIKKGVQEQLMKKMSSTDTPLGTLNMLQAKQKETQSPFVILSGSKQQQATISKIRR